MLFDGFRKLRWPILKWEITASPTRHVSNWKLRRILNAALVPFFFVRNHRELLSRRLYLPQVGLTITRRCVLNCENCAALYPHYRRQKAGDVPVDELVAVIDRFLECVDGIHAFGLGGGEPFLHPSLPLLVRKLRASPKVSWIRIYTTGMPLPGRELLEALAHPKVVVGVSDYGPLSRTLPALIEQLREHGIRFRAEANDWTDFGDFRPRDHSPERQRRMFSRCWQRECMIVINGELHYCYRSAHGMDLGLLARNPGDYVDLMAGPPGEVRERVARFLELDRISACAYCDGAGRPCPSRAVQCVDARVSDSRTPDDS